MYYFSQLGPYSCLLFASLIYASHCNVNVLRLEDNDALVKKWETASKSFDQIVWPARELIADAISDLINDADFPLTPACNQSLAVLAKGLIRRNLWAYQFMDSSARGRSGLANSYIGDIGNYDECLSIDTVQPLNDEDVSMKGKYCFLRVFFPTVDKSTVTYIKARKLDVSGTPLAGTVYEFYAKFMEFYVYLDSFRFALCFPAACSHQEIEGALRKYVNNSALQLEIRPYCETKESANKPFTEFPTYQKLSLVLLIAYTTFVLLANIYVNVYENPTLVHFSFARNSNKLFAESKDPATLRIRYVHGARFLYQVCGIFTHIWDLQVLAPVLYPYFLERNYHWFFEYMGKNAGAGIQVPILMSGFLVSYTLLPSFAKDKGNVSFWGFVVKRWFRTAPTTVGVFLIYFSLETFTSGPIMKEQMATFGSACYANPLKLLSTLFYVNNFQPLDKMCAAWTWTQSADFQLYILSFFTLALLYKKPIYGVMSAVFWIVMGVVCSSAVTWYYELPAYFSFDGTEGRQVEFSALAYTNTYNCMSVYFLGILLGYVVLNNIQIPESLHPLCWIVFPTLHAINLYIPHHWSIYGSTRTQEILYSGLHRLMYASLYTWTGYLMGVGKGGLLNRVFESKFAVPFSRLSLPLFMTQFLFIMYDTANSQQYMPTRIYNMGMKLIYTGIMCTFASYLVYLFFEAPFVGLGKALNHLKREPKRFEEKTKTT